MLCDVLLDQSSPGAEFDGYRRVYWQIDSLAPGETVELTLAVRYWSSVPDGTVLVNCVSVWSNETQPQSACEETTIVYCQQPAPTATAVPSPTMTPTPVETIVVTPTPTPGAVLWLPLILR